MRLFYQTTTQDAESIWTDGFQDLETVEDDGCAGERFVGVLLIDNPIGWNPIPDGNNLLLAIEIPEDTVSQYEWVTEVGTRKFFVPASVANGYGPPVVEEVDLLGGLLDGIDLSGI